MARDYRKKKPWQIGDCGGDHLKKNGGSVGDGGGKSDQGGGGKGKEKNGGFANQMDTHGFTISAMDSPTTHQKRSQAELIWNSGATRSMSWDADDLGDLKLIAQAGVAIPDGGMLEVKSVGTMNITKVDQTGKPNGILKLTNSLLHHRHTSRSSCTLLLPAGVAKLLEEVMT
ncbi:hypothetical protein HDU93_004821 [Gonapodya sp. JEL0774]|nr:hypothetical protein HDU93_004821 [Gonapodya sp. JEL0774]